MLFAKKSLAPWLAVAAVIALGMLLGGVLNSHDKKLLVFIGINIILAVSLNMVNGLCGQFSIGHAGFMAVGCYASIAVTYYGGFALFGDVAKHDTIGGYLLFLGSILVGGLVAALFGFVVGLPSLRLRGDYLAIVTLGFGEIIRVLLQASPEVLDADQIASTPWWSRMFHLGSAGGFTHTGYYNSLAWTFAGVGFTLLVAYRMRESTHGRAFLAVRENEIAAEAVGINTTRYKVTAFVLAAFFAGVAGALFGHEIATRPEEFNFMRSFDIVIMVVLGGMGSITGATLAAVAVTVVTEQLRSAQEYRLVAFSLLLILVMILRPQGLFGTSELWNLSRRKKT
jgi:branched-chain amino acid transport system permease protein